MNLSELFDYKNQLMDDLLTNRKIVHLLCDGEKAIDDPRELVYTQVFPYEYIPDTVQHGKTFICCDVDVGRSLNKTFLLPTLYIWVFTHRSKLRLPEGGVRTDKLACEIAEKINGSRCYGLGELDFYSIKRFAPVSDYQGKVMTFQAQDFNRLSPTGKDAPTNRKYS